MTREQLLSPATCRRTDSLLPGRYSGFAATPEAADVSLVQLSAACAAEIGRPYLPAAEVPTQCTRDKPPQALLRRSHWAQYGLDGNGFTDHYPQSQRPVTKHPFKKGRKP
jgi:hypothetical protein